MVNNHYRWDFIGLSTDEKPTPETSEKVVDGSTFYCSDNSKLYVFCQGEWYEKVVEGGGGSDINVVQTTGTSTTDVMSQNTVTGMVFADPATKYNINIGGAGNPANGGAVLLHGSSVNTNAIAIGNGSSVQATGGIALGSGARATSTGEMNIGTLWTSNGYNNTNYRLLTGVHDPVNAQDAATKAYVDANAGGGGVTELTSADYNWPESNPDGVAIWKLKKGLYYQATGTKIYVTTSAATPWNGMYLYVATDETYANVFFGNINNGWLKASYTISSGNRLSQTTFLNTTDHLVQTTGTSTSSVMSQNAVTDALNALEARIAALEGN